MTRKATILLLLLMSGAMLVVGQLYVTLPLVNDLALRWQVTPGQASLVGSTFGLAYAAGFLLLGRLSDRYGRRRVLLAGLVALAATSLAVAGSISFAMLLGTRALQGLLAAAFPPAALALVAEALPPSRRPLGISLMSFAFLAAVPTTQFLAAQSAGFGLPAIMIVVTAACLLLASGLAIILPSAAFVAVDSATPAQNTIPTQGRTGLMGVWLAASTVLFAFVSFHAGAQAMGMTAADMQALRIAGLPPLLLSIAAAGLVRRIGTIATARTGFIVAALGLLTGLPGHVGPLLVASALLSAGIALAVPGLIGTLAARAAPAVRARAMSLYTFSLFIGASIAPPFAQALAPYGWFALLSISTIVLACAAAVIGGQHAPPSRHSVSETPSSSTAP